MSSSSTAIWVRSPCWRTTMTRSTASRRARNSHSVMFGGGGGAGSRRPAAALALGLEPGGTLDGPHIAVGDRPGLPDVDNRVGRGIDSVSRRDVADSAGAAAPPAPASLAGGPDVIAVVVAPRPVVSAAGVVGGLSAAIGLGPVGSALALAAAAAATATTPTGSSAPGLVLGVTALGVFLRPGRARARVRPGRGRGRVLPSRAGVLLVPGRAGDREMLGYLRRLEDDQRRLEGGRRNRLALGFRRASGGVGEKLAAAR